MLQVRHQDTSFKILTYQNLMVSVLERSPSLADVERMIQTNSEIAAKHQRVLTVALVRGLKGVPRLDSDVIKGFEAYAKVAKPRSMGTAMVMEGSGLQMSLIRTVTSVLALAVRSTAPEKTFSEFESAVRWLVELPDVNAELRTEVDALVQEFKINHAANAA